MASTLREPEVVALHDEEVVRRVLGGEVALFEILIRRYNPRVFRAVTAILRDRAEAEDAMQQVWLSAFAHLSEFRQAAQFSTWLTRIALNEATYRRTRPLRVLAGEEELMNQPTAAADPERRAAAREAAQVLERAADLLPDAQRTVFVLRDVEGLSTAECAAALDVSEEVVKTRLHRARQALRASITELVGAAAQDAFSFGGEHCDRITRAVMSKLLAPG